MVNECALLHQSSQGQELLCGQQRLGAHCALKRARRAWQRQREEAQLQGQNGRGMEKRGAESRTRAREQRRGRAAACEQARACCMKASKPMGTPTTVIPSHQPAGYSEEPGRSGGTQVRSPRASRQTT
eukprot:6213792-Pleurochrysis_carterae.AAC.1